MGVSEPKIHELFAEVGVQISAGEVSNLLIHGQEQFHAEKDAVVEAGLRSSPWQHLDQTSTRVNGQNQIWDYYRELQAYRAQPTRTERERLAALFDEVFTPNLDYYSLDERIAKTREKKTDLLKVLEHPEIPLHNNPAELGARGRVRKRDVSIGPRNADGVKAWDTFGTLAATARQMGVSFLAYVQDRIAATNHLPGLDQIIQTRAQDLNLGMSWNTL